MPRLHAMFVHAHPDDESSKGAATMARYASEEHRVSVVTCTDGGRGHVLNPALDRPEVRERLASRRAAELAAALEVLGVTDHWWLGYPDSGHVPGWDGRTPLDDSQHLADDCFARSQREPAVARLVGLIRRGQPDVLVTYPPADDCPHPDHRRTHEITVRAFEEAADPDAHPGTGAPWQPRKLYYTVVSNPNRTRALHAACQRHGIASPFDGCKSASEDPDPSTTFVEVGAHLEARAAALRAHASQVEPNGPWFAVPTWVIAAAYPYEAFVLARSRVATSVPEDDLFAGLRGADVVGSAVG